MYITSNPEGAIQMWDIQSEVLEGTGTSVAIYREKTSLTGKVGAAAVPPNVTDATVLPWPRSDVPLMTTMAPPYPSLSLLPLGW